MSLTAQDLNDLCSQAYLDGLESAPVSELRERREACQRAELVLSYVRRVVQGEVDLVLAELDQRATGGRSDIGRLVEELPSILASPTPAGMPAHSPLPMTGDVAELGGEIALEELLAEVVADPGAVSSAPGGLLLGANLCTFSDEELRSSLGRLRDVEGGVSAKRRILHEHIDEIQAAIVERYKSGAADPDSLLG